MSTLSGDPTFKANRFRGAYSRAVAHLNQADGWDTTYGTGINEAGYFDAYHGEDPEVGRTIPWLAPTNDPRSKPFGGKDPEAGK